MRLNEIAINHVNGRKEMAQTADLAPLRAICEKRGLPTTRGSLYPREARRAR